MMPVSLKRLGRILLVLILAVQAGFGTWGTGAVVAATAPVELTEFSPGGGTAYVELKNDSNTGQDISGYTIALDGATVYTFPAGSVLAAGQLLGVNVPSSVVTTQNTLSLVVSLNELAGQGTIESWQVGLLNGVPAPDLGRSVAKIGGRLVSNVLPTMQAENTAVGLPDEPNAVTVAGDNTITGSEQTSTPVTVQLNGFSDPAETIHMLFVQGGTVKGEALGVASGVSQTISGSALQLADGPATTVVFTQGANGVRSSVLRQAVTVDVTAPLAVILKPTTEGSFSTVTYSLSQQAVEVTLDFSADPSFTTGRQTMTVPAGVAQGEHVVQPVAAGLSDTVNYFIRVTAKDAAGNVSTAVSPRSYRYDTVAPSGSFLLRATEGGTDNQGLTTQQAVQLVVPVAGLSDNVTLNQQLQIQFSNDQQQWGVSTNEQGVPVGAKSVMVGQLEFRGDSYIVTSLGRTWNLTGGNGIKTVYFRLIDEAGNVSAVHSQQIELDTRVTNLGTVVLPASTVLTNFHPFQATTDDVVLTGGSIAPDRAVTLTASRYTENPYPTATTPVGYKAVGPFFNLVMAPSDAVVYPISMRIYFTEAELAAAGVKQEQMAGLMFYDQTSGQWKLYSGTEGSTVAVKSSDREGFAGYIDVSVNHLTPLALAAKTAVVAPTNLSVTAKNGQVVMSWQASTTASKYQIYIRRKHESSDLELAGETTGTDFTVTGLTNDVTYEFLLYGIDQYGNRSDVVMAAATPMATFGVGGPKAETTVAEKTVVKNSTTTQLGKGGQVSAATPSTVTEATHNSVADGLTTALNQIDQVLTILHANSTDSTAAKTQLQSQLNLTDIQANAIVLLYEHTRDGQSGGAFSNADQEKSAFTAALQDAIKQPSQIDDLAQQAEERTTAQKQAADQQNKTTQNEENNRSDRTPWIVLGVLLALAAAATAGYFYWFRDEEDEDGTPPTAPPTTRTNGNGVRTTVRTPEKQKTETEQAVTKEEAPAEATGESKTESSDKDDTQQPPPRW